MPPSWQRSKAFSKVPFFSLANDPRVQKQDRRLTLRGYSIPNLYRSPYESLQIGELGISQGIHLAV